MKEKIAIICLMLLTATGAYAGLNDPVLVNSSFEDPVLAPNASEGIINDWFNTTSYAFTLDDGGANSQDTPYGDNWAEFGNLKWMYQQIGTWEDAMFLEVSFLIGMKTTNTFPGAHARIWVGGTPASAANDADLAAIGATMVAESALILPDLAAGPVEVSVLLSAGTGFTEGDALWLQIQSAGRQRCLIDNVDVKQLPVGPVYPANADSVVPVSSDLTWKSSPTSSISAYDVYFGSEPNELSPNYDIVKIVDKQNVTTVDPAPVGDLKYGTVYYWQVDIYEPNEVTGLDRLIPGSLWTFETEPPEPQVTVDPVGLTIDAGETVQFSVEFLNVERFQWYKQGVVDPLTNGDKISGADTYELTISDVDVTDEGSYYCVVGNDISEVENQSASAQLLTKRLVGWWKLDGDFTDSVAEEIAGAPVHSGTISDPNFNDEGFVGGSYEFFDDGRVVTIADSSDYFNFYPRGLTVSAWVKTDAGNPYATIISKRTAASPNIGWMLRCEDAAAFAVENASQVAANGQDPLADSQWHMIAGRFDGDTVRLYVDGVLAAETAENTNTIGIHPEPLVFGGARPDGSGSFGGLVDDIRIWSYALESNEIAQMYANMTGEKVCPEFPMYDFNEDCVVNLTDFVKIAQTWLKSNIVNP